MPYGKQFKKRLRFVSDNLSYQMSLQHVMMCHYVTLYNDYLILAAQKSDFLKQERIARVVCKF